MLKNELEFYIANQDELVRKYQGSVLAIKNQEVIGVYPTLLNAYLEARKEHELGTFLIQPCAPGPEAYTVTISSSNVTME